MIEMSEVNRRKVDRALSLLRELPQLRLEVIAQFRWLNRVDTLAQTSPIELDETVTNCVVDFWWKIPHAKSPQWKPFSLLGGRTSFGELWERPREVVDSLRDQNPKKTVQCGWTQTRN